jgi:AraC-like DNA-binding protein
MIVAPAGDGAHRLEASFAGHAYDAHRHDTYAIGYTIDGVQSFDYRGARVDSTADKVIVIHPDERHNGRAGDRAGFVYRMVYLAPRRVRDALGERARGLPFVRTAMLDHPRLLRVLQPMFDDLARGLDPLALDHAVLGIADSLLALDPSARGRAPIATPCAAAVERARDFLHAHCEQVIDSAQLEAVTGLDRFTLARQFRRQLGTSPYRYLTLRRLDHARARMAAGDSLTDAALASGFADQSHLTRQFRRAFGVPPGRWRALTATTTRAG